MIFTNIIKNLFYIIYFSIKLLNDSKLLKKILFQNIFYLLLYFFINFYFPLLSQTLCEIENLVDENEVNINKEKTSNDRIRYIIIICLLSLSAFLFYLALTGDNNNNNNNESIEYNSSSFDCYEENKSIKYPEPNFTYKFYELNPNTYKTDYFKNCIVKQRLFRTPKGKGIQKMWWITRRPGSFLGNHPGPLPKAKNNK